MVKTTKTKVGDWVIAFFCFILILICLLPILNIASRSLSNSVALVRNEVILLPKDNVREVIFDTVVDESGKPAVVTAVVTNNLDPITKNLVKKTYIIEQAPDGQNEAVLIETLYSKSTYNGTVNVNEETGTPLPTLTAGGVTYESSLNEETGESVIILQNAEVGVTSILNTSKLGIDLTSYIEIFKDDRYTWSLAWTAMLTVACAVLSVFITAVCAYPLTYDHLKGRKFFNTMIILTMYFGAGTIPNYLLFKSLGLIDSPFVLAIPFCLSVFNMIIMRSYFYGIPLSLRESAELDGAGPIRVMMSIYMPLSMPVVATLLLFYAVGRWNGYSDAMMFMNKNKFFYPIQYLLFNMIQGKMSTGSSNTDPETMLGTSEAMKMAMVMFAMVPILIIYPFLQRYFIAGVTLGAVKE